MKVGTEKCLLSRLCPKLTAYRIYKLPMSLNPPVSNNKRIAKNTLYLYIRMLLLMGISLFTSRVVLDVLGVEDYGIYNVVGGVIAMMGILNTSMSISVQRFLSFEMGNENNERVKTIFSISVLSHVIIALIVLLVAETFGIWFVSTQLNIPPARYEATLWVYQCAVVSALFTILQVPYTAIIMSKENMSIYAYMGILEAVLRLAIVYALLLGDWDKLKLYAVLNAVTSCTILSINILYCIKKFAEAKYHFIWDSKEVKKLTSFAGWSMFGELAWIMTGQGVNIILNIFFGPAVNAARGIAEQVNAAVNRFIQGFQTAVNPQLIKQYAAGDLDSMKLLLFRSTRFSYYLLLLLSLPIILNIDYILSLWLVEVPEHTALFCQLILISSLTMTLSNLLAQVARAYGKIRKYQSWVSFFLLLNFPLSYLVIKLGGSPESAMFVYLIISLVLIIVRLVIVKPMINLSIRSYCSDVLVRVCMVSFVSLFLPTFVKYQLSDGFLSFFLVSVASLISVSVTVYFIGLTPLDKGVVNNALSKFVSKFK